MTPVNESQSPDDNNSIKILTTDSLVWPDKFASNNLKHSILEEN